MQKKKKIKTHLSNSLYEFNKSVFSFLGENHNVRGFWVIWNEDYMCARIFFVLAKWSLAV